MYVRGGFHATAKAKRHVPGIVMASDQGGIMNAGKLGAWSVKALAILAMFGVSTIAVAAWHSGKVTTLGVSYDGTTVSFKLGNWVRSDCTCNNAWPDQMCLDRSRSSFKEEYAWLLTARTTGRVVSVNIDETSCKVIALFETD